MKQNNISHLLSKNNTIFIGVPFLYNVNHDIDILLQKNSPDIAFIAYKINRHVVQLLQTRPRRHKTKILLAMRAKLANYVRRLTGWL